jgi:hypothetical protein
MSTKSVAEPFIGVNGAEKKTYRAAQLLLAKGLWVTPCIGKQPILKEWEERQISIEELQQFLTNNPNLNIGIVWNKSAYIDIDCDSEEAETTFISWCGRRIPHTVAWQSERGKHFIFKRPDGAPDKNKLKIEGVEFRGCSVTKGAQSVCPPGDSRVYLAGQSFDDLEPAELPLLIVERLRSHERPKDTKSKGDDFLYEGERNDTLFKQACDLFRAKMESDVVLLTLKAMNTLRCQPPLEDKEVEAIHASAAKQDHSKPQSHAQIIIALALSHCSLWHTAEGVAYATIDVNGHKEHWRVRSSTFREWLSKMAFSAEGIIAGSQAMQDVLQALEGMAKYDGETNTVHLRVAGDDSRIFIDLTNDTWQALEVCVDGWRVVDDPPVRFRREKGMLPLPIPEVGGTLQELRPFVNVTADGWVLLCSWLMSAYRPSSTYPILKLIGSQGSAKTTLANVVRSLVDPNSAALRRPPKTTENLMVAANNGWLVAFDNLSYISSDLSDDLCTLSTGGSFAKRKNYTDEEETLLSAVRPILLNGIEDMGTRSDLMDRCLNVELPEIIEDKRLTDEEFKAAFTAARPRILGALFTALAGTLARLPDVKAKRQPWPRMASFAQFSTAAEVPLGFRPKNIKLDGEFAFAYHRSRETVHETALESTPLIPALLSFLYSCEEPGRFEGTATDLLAFLAQYKPDRYTKGWPKSPTMLSGMLTRFAPNMKALGWHVEKSRKRGAGKLWTIERPKGCA